MNRYRRRGVFLTQVVSMLPLIVIIGTGAVALTIQIIRFQARVDHQMTEDAALSNMAWRIGLDAESAKSATLESNESGTTLRFPTVSYRVNGHDVTRTETSTGTGNSSFGWSFERATAQVSLESISGQPRLVWVTLKSQTTVHQGPPLERMCSMAARIGGGNAP